MKNKELKVKPYNALNIFKNDTEYGITLVNGDDVKFHMSIKSC